MQAIIGMIGTVLAIVGVVLNNRLNIACFSVWIVSNTIFAALHIKAGLWSIVVRDVVFTFLAIEGWRQWSKKRRTANDD